MWMKEHPTSNPDSTTRCNSCVILLREQQEQEKEMRKQRMAQVVILSPGQNQHKDKLEEVDGAGSTKTSPKMGLDTQKLNKAKPDALQQKQAEERNKGSEASQSNNLLSGKW